MKPEALLSIVVAVVLLLALRTALGAVFRRVAASRDAGRRDGARRAALVRDAARGDARDDRRRRAPRPLGVAELRALERRARDPSSAVAVARRSQPTRHPIVLAHGYLGFDTIGLARSRREYFRGVRAALEAAGYRVHAPRVAPAASIEHRAAQLAEQITRLGPERVNIIAHSMGGLDARYAISRLGLGTRVASLTTIGTPHRGTPIADEGTRFLGEQRRVRRLLQAVGANVDGLYDLTTARMAAFNGDVPDADGVLYASVIGAVDRRTREMTTLLSPAHAYLRKISGSNDGVVPAASQAWGEVLGHVEAHHWEQIGWFGRFDARRFYALLAAHLAEWGL